MSKSLFFVSRGTLVLAVEAEKLSERVAGFKLASALDYPKMEEVNGEQAVSIEYYNILGPTGEVVDTFDQGGQVAWGKYIVQYPEDEVNPIVFNIEFSPLVILSGQELIDLTSLLHDNIKILMFEFIQGGNMPEVGRQEHYFPTV